MNISLFRHAFVLILLALVGGLMVPAMAIPRLGVAAHTVGVLSGVLLIAIGAIWQHFRLSDRQALVHKWTWLVSSYANWLGCMVGAFLGAGQMTQVASGGVTGSAFAEAVVAAMLILVAVTAFIAVGLSLWGLRPHSPPVVEARKAA